MYKNKNITFFNYGTATENRSEYFLIIGLESDKINQLRLQ